MFASFKVEQDRKKLQARSGQLPGKRTGIKPWDNELVSVELVLELGMKLGSWLLFSMKYEEIKRIAYVLGRENGGEDYAVVRS